MATGKTAFLKNSLTASVLVIGGTSIPASHIQIKSDRAQGPLKSPAKRTILPIPVRDSPASAVRLPGFSSRPPHSGGGCRTPAPPLGLPIFRLQGGPPGGEPSISARSRWWRAGVQRPGVSALLPPPQTDDFALMPPENFSLSWTGGIPHTGDGAADRWGGAS